MAPDGRTSCLKIGRFSQKSGISQQSTGRQAYFLKAASPASSPMTNHYLPPQGRAGAADLPALADAEFESLRQQVKNHQRDADRQRLLRNLILSHTIHPHDWSNSTTMCLARGRASRGGAL